MTDPLAELIGRLAAVDLGAPAVPNPGAEEALAAHIAVLDLDPRPLRWIERVADGVSAAPYARESAAWRRAWRPAFAGVADAAVDGHWLAATTPELAVWARVADAVRAELPRRTPETGLRTPRVLAPHSVAGCIAAAARWSGRSRFGRSNDLLAWIAACEPLVEAFESGLGFVWMLEDEAVCVPRPAVFSQAGLLHREDGPAIAWRSGRGHWFWRGVRVPSAAVLAPETIRARDVVRERNAEVRRVLVERMGWDRYLAEQRAVLVAEDESGRLWRSPALEDEDEPLVVVEVVNATAEPDGSRRRYFLRVPPSVETPRQAVAWTFGLDEDGYGPLAET